MKFNNFELTAIPNLSNAYCQCGYTLVEVSNGLLSRAWYCRKCEYVYTLKLVKVPESKLTKRYLDQCREEAKRWES